MGRWINLAWFSGRSIEERYSMIVISIALLFFAVNMYFDTEPVFRITQICLFLCCLAFLYFLLKQRHQSIVIGLFCLLLLVAFTFLLPYSAGYGGGMGYILQVLSTVIILLTNGKSKLVFSLLLIGLTIYMYAGRIDYSASIDANALYVDYFINMGSLCLLMFFFKRNLDFEEKQLHASNHALHQLTEDLQQQEAQLLANKQTIEQMRNSLQEEVIRRTQKLEEENKRLLEFSFINAHLVRAPIANIIGLVEMEEDNERLQELKAGIQEMDEVVRKIAHVLH